jgi:hypothetical protein
MPCIVGQRLHKSLDGLIRRLSAPFGIYPPKAVEIRPSRSGRSLLRRISYPESSADPRQKPGTAPERPQLRPQFKCTSFALEKNQ